MGDGAVGGDGVREELTPNEVFTVLGNEIRLSILRTLWEAHDPPNDTPVPFSELRKRVGVSDSGQFGYHLAKLNGRFVRATDEGYVLRQSGMKVIAAVIAGTAIEDPSLGPVEIDMTCPVCAAPLALSYEDEMLYVHCTGCEGGFRGSNAPRGTLIGTDLPPVGLKDRTPAEVFEAFSIWNPYRMLPMYEGICPECSGETTATIAVCENHRVEPGRVCDTCRTYFWGLVTHVCGTCKYSWRLPTWFHVLTHPALIWFYYDHGIEFSITNWDDIIRGLDFEERLVSTDPMVIEITVPCGDEVLRLTVDERLDVIDVDRRASG